MSLPLFRPPNTAVLYVFGVILVCLFLMGFLWMVLYAAFVPLQAGIASSMAQYDIANTTYQTYQAADTFMTTLWAVFLVVVVMGLMYWVWIYSQRKNVETGYL